MAGGPTQKRTVEGERESKHKRNVCGATRLRPEVAALLPEIEPWDMEAALPLPSIAKQPNYSTEPHLAVASLAEPREILREFEQWVAVEEKKQLAVDLLTKKWLRNEDKKEGDQVLRVLETRISKVNYQDMHNLIVYVPLLIVRYTHGDPQDDLKEFFFVMNGINGTHVPHTAHVNSLPSFYLFLYKVRAMGSAHLGWASFWGAALACLR